MLRLFSWAFAGYIVLFLILALVTITGGGKPDLWLFALCVGGFVALALLSARLPMRKNEQAGGGDGDGCGGD